MGTTVCTLTTRQHKHHEPNRPSREPGCCGLCQCGPSCSAHLWLSVPPLMTLPSSRVTVWVATLPTELMRLMPMLYRLPCLARGLSLLVSPTTREHPSSGPPLIM